MALLVFGGLGVLLVVRCFERPVYGVHRPLTPFITVFVCRGALWILGLRLHVDGTPMQDRGAVVANHSSWLDVFVLNAVKRIYFVSKSEVAGWPGIGWLARATGTVFIERNPQKAVEQTKLFQDRLLAGHKLLFFPEGTSTDGKRVLPFKSTLFGSFFTSELVSRIKLQPVTVVYCPPSGADPRLYGWWGDMSFGAHLLVMLSTRRHGIVRLTYHPPISVAGSGGRKPLAKQAEDTVRARFEQDQAMADCA
jgi:1-acyl-sn-glycerol-3-phosphate acyltransferase